MQSSAEWHPTSLAEYALSNAFDSVSLRDYIARLQQIPRVLSQTPKCFALV